MAGLTRRDLSLVSFVWSLSISLFCWFSRFSRARRSSMKVASPCLMFVCGHREGLGGLSHWSHGEGYPVSLSVPCSPPSPGSPLPAAPPLPLCDTPLPGGTWLPPQLWALTGSAPRVLHCLCQLRLERTELDSRCLTQTPLPPNLHCSSMCCSGGKVHRLLTHPGHGALPDGHVALVPRLTW